MCLSLSESFSCFPPLFLFSPLVEGHLKEVIPILLCFLSLLSEGALRPAPGPIHRSAKQKPAHKQSSRGEGNSLMREIAAFYPPGVNSKIMPPFKALGDAQM